MDWSCGRSDALNKPLVVIPHGGLLIPPAVPMSEWPIMATDEHDWGTDWVYEFTGLIPDVTVIKFPYSLEAVNVEDRRADCRSDCVQYFDSFHWLLRNTPCTYALVGHSSCTGKTDKQGRVFKADLEVFSGYTDDKWIPTVPVEHVKVFIGRIRELMPNLHIEINTTYVDCFSSVAATLRTKGVPSISMEVNENLYIDNGKTNVAKLNVVRRVLAEAYKSVLLVR